MELDSKSPVLGGRKSGLSLGYPELCRLVEWSARSKPGTAEGVSRVAQRQHVPVSSQSSHGPQKHAEMGVGGFK